MRTVMVVVLNPTIVAFLIPAEAQPQMTFRRPDNVAHIFDARHFEPLKSGGPSDQIEAMISVNHAFTDRSKDRVAELWTLEATGKENQFRIR